MMFFFGIYDGPYIIELGIQEVVDGLQKRGHPSEWPLKIWGPDEGATFHPRGGRFHKSKCHNYEGYWWAGGFGAVQCAVAPSLLPGIVHDLKCEKRCENCPFYRESLEKEHALP